MRLSPADDVLISVERPSHGHARADGGLDPVEKGRRGIYHLLIDLPVGSTAKLRSAIEAVRLRKFFEFVGDHVGIAGSGVHRWPQPSAPGSGRCSRRTMLWRSRNSPGRRRPARNTAVLLAGRVLEFDPALSRAETGSVAGARTARQRRRAQADAQDHRCPRARPTAAPISAH